MRSRCARVLATLVVSSLVYAGGARAQSEPAAQPEARPAPPPPGYPPPSGYPPPPPPGYGYYPPAPGYYYQQPPANLPYHPGEPIPPGYRHEKRPRTGLIIAGAIVTGVPYILGLSIASASKYSNAGGYLAIPAIGPWITLAARDDHSCIDYSSYSGTVYANGSCAEDVVVKTFLVMDALIQTTGAILFVIGVSSDRDVVIRQDLAKLHLAPLHFNHGYGLGVSGGF